jgi:hypothetical protein
MCWIRWSRGAGRLGRCASSRPTLPAGAPRDSTGRVAARAQRLPRRGGSRTCVPLGRRHVHLAGQSWLGLDRRDAGAAGFQEFLSALRDEVIAFGKPVAYVHGDSHTFRVDKPFLDDQGRRLENFTRVETFGNNAGNGNNDVHWVKVLVDARNREVFAYQPQIVPGNRTAVPLP